MEIKKYFKIYMYYNVNIDVLKNVLNGTTAKTETLKIVFAHFVFSSRRYDFWLECSTLTFEIFPIHRKTHYKGVMAAAFLNFIFLKMLLKFMRQILKIYKFAEQNDHNT